MATRYEKYITGDDGGHLVWTSGWYAQTFTPSVDHIVTSVKVKIHRVGAVPGTLTAHIRATISDLPSGSDLGSGTTDGDDVTDNTDGEWIEITLASGVLALAGTKYGLILSGPAGVAAGNYIQWHTDGSSPAYNDGALCVSGDSGASWSENTGNDEMFEEWGDPEGSGEGGAIFPSDDVARASSIRHIFRPGFFRMQVGLSDLGLDIDIAESTVRAALDTAKEVEPPVEPVVTEPSGIPPGEPRWEARISEEEALREADPRLWAERDRIVREEEMKRQEALAEEMKRLEETSHPLETRLGRYTCSHCGARFSTALALTRHIESTHPGESAYGRGIYGGGL